MDELTLDPAALQSPPPEMARLLSSIQGDQQDMEAFARMNAGDTPPVRRGASLEGRRDVRVAGVRLGH